MTIASMTGFARTQGNDDRVGWIWEARSVNGRGLEVRVRLPAGYDALEVAARDAVAKRLKRGNVNLALLVQHTAALPAYRVNEALLAELAEAARVWRHQFPDLAPPTLDGLLALKGVVEPAEAQEAEEEREARQADMLRSLDQALETLSATRIEEGRRLETVLVGQLDLISQLVLQAESHASLRPEARKERLRTLVQSLLDAVPALSEERLSQEAVLLVAKADVREELDRLKAHVASARDMLKGGGAVGRRLDFLCQEFNREANTLCSKSSDLELTRVGLDLKAVIEQFREQVQNIE